MSIHKRADKATAACLDKIAYYGHAQVSDPSASNGLHGQWQLISPKGVVLSQFV